MMIYGIFSDLHGTDPEPIRDMFKARKIDKGICLGDFDRTYVARKVMDIQKEYDLHVIPGNHDHSHINKVDIRSGTMSRQGIDSPMMWKEWERDPVARKYVEDLLKSPTIELEIGGNKTLTIHGGLDGVYETEPAYLWNRIKSQNDYMANFEKMKSSGYKIMLRGHDHKAQFARLDPESGFKEYETENSGYNLFNKRMHIINPGAFYNGNYATITTGIKEHPILEFFKL